MGEHGCQLNGRQGRRTAGITVSQRSRLLGHGLGNSLTTVAHVHEPLTGQRIEIRTALRITDLTPSPFNQNTAVDLRGERLGR